MLDRARPQGDCDDKYLFKRAHGCEVCSEWNESVPFASSALRQSGLIPIELFHYVLDEEDMHSRVHRYNSLSSDNFGALTCRITSWRYTWQENSFHRPLIVWLQ